MTKLTFYADVRAAIGRGTANDGLFDGWGQEAMSQLENEHTYTWMKQTLELPLVAGANSNRVALGVPVIKAINWAKFGLRQGVGASQVTVYGRELDIIDARQVASIDLGYAGYAYQDGTDLVLDALPQEASTLFVNLWAYTQWDELDDGDTPPVLSRHYAGFKAYFMMIAAANLRDAGLAQIWSGRADRGVAAMIAADTDTEWKGRRRLRIGGDNA